MNTEQFAGVGALPVPASASEPTLGSVVLRKPWHERYARARSLLRPKIEAYRYARGIEEQPGDTKEKIHAIRGNASKLERRKDVQARIAFLSRQDEEVLAAKRQRLEEFLWSVHEVDPADLWEIVESPKLDADGEPIIDENTGEAVMERHQRLRFMAELPEDVRRTVQSIKYTESGRPQVERYSAMQANQELRKLLGIGASTDRDGNEFERMSDRELIGELSRQAQELGVNVTLSYQMGDDR